MAANSRFSVAVHALSLMGYFNEGSLTSELIASSVNTNPVVIRRILGTLRKAGLVESQPGNQGGLRLAKSPEKITMADIYNALETERFMAVHGNPENRKCPVSRNIKPILEQVLDSTEVLIARGLAATTLADMVVRIKNQDRK